MLGAEEEQACEHCGCLYFISELNDDGICETCATEAAVNRAESRNDLD